MKILLTGVAGFLGSHLAKKLIDESGLKVQSAIQLSEAADLVKKAVA